MDDEEVQKLFGEKIRDCRKKKGLSQEELSELIGKTPDTVSNIERGFTSTKIKTAVTLANALDVPLTELFDLHPLTPDERNRQHQIQNVVEMLKPCDEVTFKGAIEVLEAFLRATSNSSAD